MKFSSAAVVSLGCVQYSTAFLTPQFATRSIQSSKLQLNAEVEREVPGWVGPVSTVVAGLTVAAQTVGATDVDLPTVSFVPGIEISNAGSMLRNVQSAPSSAISGTSIAVSDSEYLDFSLPSYGSSVGETTAKPKAEAPSFGNPFGDFDFQKREEPSTTDSSKDTSAAEAKATAEKEAADKKAEEKAKADKEAAEKKRAEADAKADKEAVEKRRAEEKAAKEAEKEAAKQKEADEKAAAEAKKAEKEARRKAELEKQRAAVERQKAKDAADAAAAAAANEAKSAPAPVPAPAPAPKPISVPDVKAPEFKAPDIKLDIPDFKSPDIKLDIPEFKVPDVKIPSFSMPKVDLPEMPKTSGAPAMSAPKFDIPKAPSVSMPKLDIRTEVDEDVEPQEVRDDRAKEARSVYKEADDRAKELEAKAAALRQAANEKKKVAKEAKDDACKTRIGGKVLCIRPLNSGY